MLSSSPARAAASDRRSRRRPKAAAMRPQMARARKATTSSGLVMARVRYGSVRKKLRLMADTTAVSSAADRPPISAITMVKARKAKARLEAGVRVRSGTSAPPRASAPRPPTAIQIRLSFRAPMPRLLLVALLHELMPIEAHPPLLAETARRRAAAPAWNSGFESQRRAQLRRPLIPLGWLPAHDALSFSRSNLHVSPLFVSRRGSLSSCSAACIKKSSSRQANASRNRQGEGAAAHVLDARWRAVAILRPVERSSSMDERGGRVGFAFQDENCHSEDSPPDAAASRGRAAEGSEQEERPVLVQRPGGPLGQGDVGAEVCRCSPDEP